jgi:hypothetical protein
VRKRAAEILVASKASSKIASQQDAVSRLDNTLGNLGGARGGTLWSLQTDREVFAGVVEPMGFGEVWGSFIMFVGESAGATVAGASRRAFGSED